MARELSEALRGKGYPVRDVLLFGSVAKGTADVDSDIDLAVICQPFRSSHAEENGEFLWVSKDIDLRIETVCLHPEDFENRYSTLAQEVKQRGISVADSNRAGRP